MALTVLTYPFPSSTFSSFMPVLSFFYLYCYTISFLCHLSQASVTVKINNLLICFCSFDLFCPILEKDNFIENVYIVLSCLIK